MEFFNSDIDGFPPGSYLGFQEMMKSSINGETAQVMRAVLKPPGLLQHQRPSSEEKAMIALRNHSQAERRRRERINGHLATLRTLIPGTNKMDKAALLAEVISQVKELKRNVASATDGALVPTEVDEVKVEQEESVDEGMSSFCIRASLCCDFKHQLLSDLKEAIESLPLKMVRSEIATLGSRMVNVFVIARSNEDSNIEDLGEGGQVLVDCVHQSLRSVLDKFYASEEFTSTNALSGKRRRGSFFGPSGSSSSTGDVW
ncbi:transcription factor bHLH30-like [Andrographis paniculata]|uniref:transcription factor bHLH30-like n=1 Tax=Andrographis paniculata TaxID=175694 RepID=UPI0021E6F8D3|nr:transcription factor bHLH30-like [Andrographis paniculata]